jgi:23S rRNA (adenine2503-C2)-methyltransferase
MPFEVFRFTKPEEEISEQFMHYLERNRVNSRLCKSGGKDIDAACGQLANK